MKLLNLFRVVLMFSLLVSFSVCAETEEKLVYIKGSNSYLMEGDLYNRTINKPKGYSPDSVLPALMSSGWFIKHVYIDGKSPAGGYVLLQRDR